MNSKNSEEYRMSTLDLTKLQLKIGWRREKKIYDEIRKLTKNIVNLFQDFDKKQVTQNLKQELELHRIIDYNLKCLCRRGSLADIISALEETEERRECFFEQYTFINEAINNDGFQFIFPHQLLNMSYERQRFFSGYISKNKYRPHIVTYGTITIDSDSESEEQPVPVPVEKTLLEKNFTAADPTCEIIKYEGEGVLDQCTARRWFEKFSSGDTERKKGSERPLMDIDEVLKEAVESNPSTSTPELARECGVSKDTVSRHLLSMGKRKDATNENVKESKKASPQDVDTLTSGTNNIFQDDDDEADYPYYAPARPPSPEAALAQDNGNHSGDKSKGGTAQSPIDPAFLAPGCSKWIIPFRKS